jgi:ABC-type cobalamin/Fe3+-siderophores transport system ATPase subunit
MAGTGVAVGLDRHEYAATVERSEELARLKAQAQKRKSMLIFGPEAIGKTRLLKEFSQKPAAGSPRCARPIAAGNATYPH